MILECFIVATRQSTMADGKPRSVWTKVGVFADERDAVACYKSVPVMGGQTGKIGMRWTAHRGATAMARTLDSNFDSKPGCTEGDAEEDSLLNAISNAVLDFCLAVDRDANTTDMETAAKQHGG